MTIQQIILFGAASILIRWLVREKGRVPALAILSMVGIYVLQPVSPVRYLDFWLPTTALVITVLVWISTHPAGTLELKKNLPGLGMVVGLVLVVALMRYTGFDRSLLPSTPPLIEVVVVFLLLGVGLTAGAIRVRNIPIYYTLLIGLLLVLFIIIKTPAISSLASYGLRVLNQQAVDLASPLDIRWLGFSYLAFRLLHVLRDRQAGKTFGVSFLEFLVYAIFFPAYTAGPIDRLDRFAKDLRRPLAVWSVDFAEGGKRLVIGLFKKFVLADSLALIAINQVNVTQVNQSGWLWILLYAYSFQIYFDFSGYTDIALGLGRLVGINLPENFNQPYLKPNLTLFWNNWHMTLTQWFRAYYFNPLARWLRSRSQPVQQGMVIFLGQVSTMVLIGLWHGITLNFILWGLWHGLGLFFQNRWSEWVRASLAPRLPAWLREGAGKTALDAAGALLTFHFVSLGWLWFALSDPTISLIALHRLFGGG
jgi:D-alanyl-lipoteichoic acid acyltransferase DltB (MBOAT superfamily)